MRICLGDRILKLKRVKDLEKLYNRRKNGKAEIVQRAWATHSSGWLARVWKSVGNSCSWALRVQLLGIWQDLVMGLTKMKDDQV
jgi:hypothetical protein